MIFARWVSGIRCLTGRPPIISATPSQPHARMVIRTVVLPQLQLGQLLDHCVGDEERLEGRANSSNQWV